MNNLWVNKYKPNNLDEIFGNKNQIKRIKEWLSNTNNSKSMSLIISGNHGIGKTISMKYVLESCDYNVKMAAPCGTDSRFISAKVGFDSRGC